MKLVENVYIVRIYRRNEKDPHDLTGVVEEPRGGESRCFQNSVELGRVIAEGFKAGKKKTPRP